MNNFKENRSQQYRHKLQQEKANPLKKRKQTLKKVDRLQQRAQAVEEHMSNEFESGHLPKWQDHEKVLKKTEQKLETLGVKIYHQSWAKTKSKASQ